MRKFLIILTFIIFPLTGFFTVSYMVTAEAQCPPNATEPCIGIFRPPGDLSAAMGDYLYQFSDNYIPQITGILASYYPPLTGDTYSGMQMAMDWTFRELSDWFDTFWNYNLQPEMQQMTQQLSTANVEQTFALGMFADAANVIRTRRVLDDMAIKDHREQRPGANVCTAGSVMSSMERATAFSDAYLVYGAGGSQWIAANTWNTESADGFAQLLAIGWEGNAPNASWGGFPVATGGTWGYVPLWCNKDYNNGFAGCAANGKVVGQDVDVAGQLFAQDTIPLDTTQDPLPYYTKGNLDEMIGILAEAFGKDPVTAGLAGKDGILDAVSYRTKRQVVYDSLYYVVSRRVPGGLRAESSVNPPPARPNPPVSQANWNAMPEVTGNGKGLADLLKEIRAESGEDGSTGCGGTGQSPCTSPNPSRNEILRAMLTQRFQSGKFALRGIDEPENNAREQVIDQALQLMQMSDQMDLMDHYSLLLTSQIGAEVVRSKPLSAASSAAPLTQGGGP